MRLFRFALLVVLAAALAAAPLARALAMSMPVDDAGHAHCGSLVTGDESGSESGDDSGDDCCSQLCGWACSMSHALDSPAPPALAALPPETVRVALAVPIAHVWHKAPIRPPIS